MAEIIGLTASIFTLAGTGVTVGKIIRSLKNAPNELLALANEISDLEVLLPSFADFTPRHRESRRA